jgi:hypothetical protein
VFAEAEDQVTLKDPEVVIGVPDTVKTDGIERPALITVPLPPPPLAHPVVVMLRFESMQTVVPEAPESVPAVTTSVVFPLKEAMQSFDATQNSAAVTFPVKLALGSEIPPDKRRSSRLRS